MHRKLVARLCCSWLSSKKVTRIFQGRIQLGQYSCKKKKVKDSSWPPKRTIYVQVFLSTGFVWLISQQEYYRFSLTLSSWGHVRVDLLFTSDEHKKAYDVIDYCAVQAGLVRDVMDTDCQIQNGCAHDVSVRFSNVIFHPKRLFKFLYFNRLDHESTKNFGEFFFFFFGPFLSIVYVTLLRFASPVIDFGEYWYVLQLSND